jgi:hypothetical protein
MRATNEGVGSQDAILGGELAQAVGQGFTPRNRLITILDVPDPTSGVQLGRRS